MKTIHLSLIVILLFFMSSCNNTFIKGKDAKGDNYTAIVAKSVVNTPGVGAEVCIIKTDITDGYIYNAADWKEKDSLDLLILHRKVVKITIDTVIE